MIKIKNITLFVNMDNFFALFMCIIYTYIYIHIYLYYNDVGGKYNKFYIYLTI